jgi:hypothetical protein
MQSPLDTVIAFDLETIAVSSDPIDAAGLDLLEKCASSPQMAYVANDSSDHSHGLRGDREEHRKSEAEPVATPINRP